MVFGKNKSQFSAFDMVAHTKKAIFTSNWKIAFSLKIINTAYFF